MDKWAVPAIVGGVGGLLIYQMSHKSTGARFAKLPAVSDQRKFNQSWRNNLNPKANKINDVNVADYTNIRRPLPRITPVGPVVLDNGNQNVATTIANPGHRSEVARAKLGSRSVEKRRDFRPTKKYTMPRM